MFQLIVKELREHFPFTFIGAFSGIVFAILFRSIPPHLSYKVYYTLHPVHVFFSALVTASMYKLSIGEKYHPVRLLLIGYLGSVGIATLSDALIPYAGEALLQLPHKAAHVGFIEEWWLVNPLALLGIALAFLRPVTKLPHAGHVLTSTYASLFHMIMAMGEITAWYIYLAVFLFLFISVWLPCCVSDIIFPLLFVPGQKKTDANLPRHDL